ncbi:acyl-CoA dehydrogenase family protein [Sphingobium sp.]|uniref:acyl-CoA dehydrogenase family protein n=1 Tax=Sphingobium sp. TaxID=1912891 RepID=UPI0028BE9D34|nr:acyl-CoA dehydrogenase family protein [Sphingobium sp.]
MAIEALKCADDSSLSVEELVERARELAPALAERTSQTERDGRVSEELTRLVKDAGLNRVSQPRGFGGFGHGPSAVFKVCYEMARACPSTSWCAMVANSNAWFASYWPEEVQRDIWGDDPTTMVAISGIPVGKGRKVDGGYEIWGAWPWASNSDNCDWAIVSSAIADVEGENPETQWFIVPMAELHIDQDSWDMAGMQGTGSKTLLRKEPLFVPENRRVKLAQVAADATPGREIPGNEVARYNFATLSGVVLLGPVLGMAQGALDAFTEAMKSKVKTSLSAGASVTAGATPAVQMRVADASARIDAAVALLLSSVEPFETRVAAGGAVSVEERVRVRRNIGFAARQAFEAINILAEGAGASSFASRSMFQRFWRDLSVGVRHVTLDTDAIYQMYGQERFGLPPAGAY